VNAVYKKVLARGAFAALVLIFVAGCSSPSNPNTPPMTSSPLPLPSSSQAYPNSITYKSTKYNFSFSLPKSWTGYSIVKGKWEGNDVKSGSVTETGAMVAIRHPLWSAAHLRQDIPILILTISQWKLIQQSVIHIGAAPIPPSELGRNSKYVFALPARYNFAFPTGFQEVEEILKSKPLHAN
jgi:hypothetical protein